MATVVRIPRLLHACVLACAALIGSGRAMLSAQSEPPPWFLEEIKGATAGSGRWITDNRTYVGPNEPADQYGLEWRKGLGGLSMTGRLFGLRAGQEIATYWQFLIYWHPDRQVAVMLQVSAGGVVGEGTMMEAEGGTVAEQVFYSPDGGNRRVRHESVVGEQERRDNSFDWADGAWRAGRSYTWRRTPG